MLICMKITYIKVLITSFIIGLLIPFVSHAQIVITEIMYDPAGADTKREWIEVFNESNQEIDLTTWFFLENNVFHKITAHTSAILGPGAYAIIADSIPEVLAEYSTIPLIFDSAFSLNNTGEPLSIANPSKEIKHTITYSSEFGANNDGNSLQINEGQIISAVPTPGLINSNTPQVPKSDTGSTNTSTNNSSTTTSQSTHTQQVPLTTYSASTPFKVGAGRHRIVPMRTPIEFIAETSHTEQSIKYNWNLGDLNTRLGQNITHIYKYPGTYQIVLTATSGQYTSVTRTKVTVIEPQIEITQDQSVIQINNTSKEEINIGDFVLNFIDADIKIPPNTIIEAGGSITISRQPYQVLVSINYFDDTIYTEANYQDVLISSYMWCIQNSHKMGCKDRYIIQLFDIIKRWLS
jgi:hypothetical protein